MADVLDHALVGNGRVLALIRSERADVQWLCLPRFDAPSVFGRLLDDDHGGGLAVEGAAPQRVASWYHRDTNVLRHRFEVADGAFVIDDFCPVPAGDSVPSAALVRFIEPTQGTPTIWVRFDPRPDYARDRPTLSVATDAIWMSTDLALYCSSHASDVLYGRPIVLDRPLALVMAHGAPGIDVDVAGVRAARDAARLRGRAWVADLAPQIRRSALALAALCYTPTGAIIAAATTSVPEAIGTPRCWDYRFAWVRDGAFTAELLSRLGHAPTARRFLGFLHAFAGDAPQPLFGIGGERELTETTLTSLRGFAHTGPVRVGNAAATQVQHDSCGQILWLAERLHAADGGLPDAARWAWLAGLIDRAKAAIDVPDAGIWEFRDRPARYTYSQVWIWVALARGAALAEALGDPRAAGWRADADALRRRLLAAADRVGFFAQTLDAEDVDASSLQFATLGLVPATDPRFVATVRRCEAVLLVDGLMRRYVAEDDFGDTTSTFSLCTLWWIRALADMGETDRARARLADFERFANPFGLYAEDVEPDSGRQLGNFPQAYTHLALIDAHLALHG